MTNPGSTPLLPRTRLLIICDIKLYREGLRHVMGQQGSIEVVGTASSADDALAEVERFRPEAALLDARLPDGATLLRALLAHAPQLKVAILGVKEEPASVLEWVEAGAAAYVPREGSVADLTAAVEAAIRGDVVCSPRIAGSLFRHVATLAGGRPPEGEISALTPRERDVLLLIEKGMSNKEIARRLDVRLATVKNHVHHILEKLGVRRRGAAAAIGRSQGWHGEEPARSR